MATAHDATHRDTLVLAFRLDRSTLDAERIGADVAGIQRLPRLLGRTVRTPAAALAEGLDCSGAEVAAVLRRRGDMFLKTELADDMNIIDLNLRSTVRLAKLVLRDMANRNEGKVLFTSSVTSMRPGFLPDRVQRVEVIHPVVRRSAAYELRDTAITVTALIPGPTDTNFLPSREIGRDSCRQKCRRTILLKWRAKDLTL